MFVKVCDGDTIDLDILHRQVNLQISVQEIAEQRAAWQYRAKTLSGYLLRYARNVSSAAKGAVLE